MIETKNAIVSKALRERRTTLTEPEAKLLCRDYSIPVPEFVVVHTQEEAVDISKKLGFPLAAKIVSPQVIHKTDAGGVVLNILSPQGAKKAFAEIHERIRRYDPSANFEGVLLERMQPPGLELIVGATHDPQFGKTLMFGIGGVFVEVLHDVALKLAPLLEDEAGQMLNAIQSRNILSGFRGGTRADRGSIIHILLAASKLITENDAIAEFDLNPIIAYEKGAIAVDARVILSQEPRMPSVSAYPASSLLKFFKAESVAVVGASGTSGKIGHEVLRSLSQYEYPGKVFPINPSSDTILGMKAYPNIRDVPDKIDLAVLTVPSKFAPSIMEECGRKGVRAAVIVSGGFKETGLQHVERVTVETAQKYGIRIIGPNCIGVLDGHSKLDTFFQSHERMTRPKGGSVAFITQSGTFGTTILEWAAEANIGISKFVSYGNRCDVDEGDLVEFFGQDQETSLVGVYVEGLDNGRKLYDAARKVTPRKPIVILKSGKTELGSRAAKSHTGWLAGSYHVARAAFEQAGMIVSENIEQLFDCVKALAWQPLPTGPKVVMVTNGAGPCVMAADRIEEYGMSIAPLSSATVSELSRTLPPYCLVSETTVDLTGSATSKDYEVALQVLANDTAVNVLMPFFVFQDTPLDEGIVEVLARIKHSGKPVICCAAGGSYTRMMSKKIEASGIPVYETAERAVGATHALIRQAQVAGRMCGT